MRLATAVLAAAALMAPACGEATPGSSATDDEAPTPVVGAGSWQEISEAPVGFYRPEGLFWIEGRLVAVAGSIIQSWSQGSRDWKKVVSIPQADECEGCGYSEAAVWTGAELLLWGGGFSYRAPDGRAHDGVSVTLDGEVRPIAEAPIPNRWWHGAVWTGEEMIVFGGGDDAHGRRDGAAYDPSTGTWRAIATAPIGGYANSLVWTGTEMITWGGIKDANEVEGEVAGFPEAFVAEGAAYDPATDSWRVLEASGLEPRGWHSAVWTGREMIVWGGVKEPTLTCYDCGYPEDAGAYDPSTDTWREIDPGSLSGRVEHTAVWTGEAMIIYGGSAPGGGKGRDDGAIYDAASDTWRLLPDAPIVGRYRHAALWNGESMILWGGQTPSGTGSLADGSLFSPR